MSIVGMRAVGYLILHGIHTIELLDALIADLLNGMLWSTVFLFLFSVEGITDIERNFSEAECSS